MNQRGFIYITALGIALLLAAAGASLLVRGVEEKSVSERSRNLTSALHLAEAAIDQSLINLRTTPAGTTVSGTTPAGTYAIDSVTQVSSQVQQVTAHGTVGSERRDLEVVIQQTGKSVFQYALFGDQTVNVSGNGTTDSYDSRNGAYDSSTNHAHHGDVGTNATTAGGIAVGGSIFVDGQLAVGANVSNPQSVVTGFNPSFVTGGTSPPSDTQDVVAQSSTFPMPAVTVPGGLTCSDFTVTGNTTVTLSPTGGPLGNGTYCYHDLTVQGGAQLVPSGPVTVYLTGQMSAKGNSVVGSSSNPTQMLIQMSPASAATLEQGTITGSTEFYGAIYGPNATMNIQGNAKVFGSIIAKTVNLTGSAEIHYDTALAANSTVSNSFTTKVVEWRSLN